MRKPDLFIIGAPKCGTTALSEYLKAHPQVCFSPVKEPNCFAADVGPRTEFFDVSTYLGLFEHACERHVAVGEATPFYLRSRQAVPRILDLNPDARFIVMLRNPLEMAHALHSTNLLWRSEVVRSFERAWALQSRRADGRSIPPACPNAALLQYGWFCRLGEQLDRLLGLAPRDRVLVVLFDDFRKEPQFAYERVLTFLGLEHDGREDFSPVNSHRRHYLHSLRAAELLVRKPPERVKYLTRMVKDVLGVESFGIARVLHCLNQTVNISHAPRPALSDAMRSKLCDYFADDIALLSRVLGRDLSWWLGEG